MGAKKLNVILISLKLKPRSGYDFVRDRKRAYFFCAQENKTMQTKRDTKSIVFTENQAKA